MLRPSTFATVSLSLCAVALFGGCRTIYSDMYSPRRSYFKPVKDKPKPAEVLPEPTVVTTPLPGTAPAPPPVPPPVSAPLEAPPPTAPAPTPGL